MLFVPLSLFATFFLLFLCGRFVLTRDMSVRAHQYFAGVLALYAVQSLLTSLRWGYEIIDVMFIIVLLAPILPAIAYLSYAALSDRKPMWPFTIVILHWLVFALFPALSDLLILLTYLGFGLLLLRMCWTGADDLALPSLNDARDIVFAMGLTGGALIASGLTDLVVIYDFMRNQGRNTGFILTFVQTTFVLLIGLSALSGRAIAEDNAPIPVPANDEDAAIIARLEALFTGEHLHRRDDLSLRRMARRLGISDRQVSNAINRTQHISVSQFVNTYRIKDACILLTNTDQSILDISLASGFASKSNFNREFLRIMGQPPSRWRAQN